MHVIDEAALPPAEALQAWSEERILLKRRSGEWCTIARKALLEMQQSQAGQDRLASLLSPVTHVYPDQALDIALREIHELPLLPVVHRAAVGVLVGVISVDDIVSAYRGKAREGGVFTG